MFNSFESHSSYQLYYFNIPKTESKFEFNELTFWDGFFFLLLYNDDLSANLWIYAKWYCGLATFYDNDQNSNFNSIDKFFFNDEFLAMKRLNFSIKIDICS